MGELERACEGTGGLDPYPMLRSGKLKGEHLCLGIGPRQRLRRASPVPSPATRPTPIFLLATWHFEGQD